MPEAPGIIILADLVKRFIGKKVIEVEGIISETIKQKLTEHNLVNVQTYGKQLLLVFPEHTLSVHLMLFGSYTINDVKSGKLTIGLLFENGNLNFYSSTIKLIEKPLDEVFDWRLEVMNERFNKKLAAQNLRKSPNEVIVDAMIDQHNLAGVGNKIRNEVLFRVGVHPLNKVKNIPQEKLSAIVEECVKLSFEMLEWKKEEIEEENLLIYQGKECPRDKMPVQKEKLSSRSIYFCDKCQELYD